jgi:hypothetical protein
MRWREERGMKGRHMPVALRHNPLFVLRNAIRMFAHTYRGSTIKSLIGWEDERKAFERYRTRRHTERAYL